MDIQHTLYLVLLFGLPVVLCQCECGDVIGTANETEYTEATDSMIYLNLDSPVRNYCNISRYRFCHYPTEQIASGPLKDRLRFNTILAVFRKINDTYMPVPGSNTTVNINKTFSSFRCSDFQIRNGIVQLQPGDVLGACVGRRQGNSTIRHQLNIVGKNASGFSLSGAPTIRCNSRIFLRRGARKAVDFTNMPGRILYLSAGNKEEPAQPTQPTIATNLLTETQTIVISSVATTIVLVVIVVLLIAALLWRRKNHGRSKMIPVQQQLDAYMLYNEAYSETRCPETNVKPVPVESDATCGITETVHTEENIPTDINPSYHVTRRPSEEGSEYYSVIPTEGGERVLEITETTNTMEMITNEAYITTAVHDNVNPYYITVL